MTGECRTRLISTTIIMGNTFFILFAAKIFLEKLSLERLLLKRILNLFSCDSLKIYLTLTYT